MKTSVKLVLTLITLGLTAVSPCAQAAEKPAKAGQRAKAAAEEHDKMLTEKLKLTAEQQEKLATIRKEQAAGMKANRGDRATDLHGPPRGACWRRHRNAGCFPRRR